MVQFFWLAVVFALSGLAGTAAAQQTLDQVHKRGRLECGVSPIAPGFSYLDSQGRRRGFDVDLCRAVAAAIFADDTKVDFVPLDTNIRYEALRSTRVDVLIAQATWTFTRDTRLGLDFGPVVFHDGQGIMARSDLAAADDINALAGAAVCLLPGTTSEQNLEDYLRTRSLKYEPVVFQNADEWRNAFLSGRCDAVSADRSILVSVRAMANEPEKFAILSKTISKEPLAPVVRANDSSWRDIISWVVFALLAAEEKGITTENLQDHAHSSDPETRRLLGETGNFGSMLSLSDRWAFNVLRLVGNYGQIFDRHFGPGSTMPLPRGPNKLTRDGGYLYAPPFR
ncbi:amino acid ABC transporter substrate-binding protein (plasmid) [Bradyrhizobium sp. ISRA443]|uniref:amino acid ABC transporter substrate-binding protein n=1 Tax=unclassified Bradyrhizobium TaxID=2631580 RepID=UPI00247A8577|nr:MULTISPECIES: amino acid ABC transporter substrate-binding protein [unclassified Bradyrhizobium]WGR90759.1 amino acid ABC transporter substrate-binding protein [Bradyrhizobium sp. ISRA435]WGS03110.1 amino acid ABC transporter substrate-binding protein [Bradyrhizobium sp. ISRA436]WGS09857.1 amino acid ABC transporter substrate-binding protein [Bradyrhizobium sp. ISRA437]WGS16742.1 amino acid ABC transporter substrate-binding protein [Bradyrhizobium sp. ISRA443]